MVDRAFDNPQEMEEHACAPLAGGIARHGYQCGIVWGATLAAGTEAHRRFGAGPRAEGAAIAAAQAIVSSFRGRNGAVDCFDLTGTDFRSKAQTWKYLLKGTPVRCFRMAAGFAPVAKAGIDAALPAERAEAADGPVSCAALAARKMGATERHAVMVAGFAGGIGLSGDACGALGAAVWLGALKSPDTTFRAMEARATPIIDRFLEASGHRFECAEITGRAFGSVGEHAAFVREGGCARIVESLAR